MCKSLNFGFDLLASVFQFKAVRNSFGYHQNCQLLETHHGLSKPQKWTSETGKSSDLNELFEDCGGHKSPVQEVLMETQFWGILKAGQGGYDPTMQA
jgi:hypothetical protein